MFDYKKNISKLAWIVFGRLFLFGIAFASVRVLSAVLTPVEIGILVSITTTTSFFAMLFINPVGMFVNRRIISWVKQGKIFSYLIIFFIYLSIISFVTALILLFFSYINLIDFGINNLFAIFLISISLLINSVNQTIIPSLNLVGYEKSFIILSNASAAFSLLFACIFASFSANQPIFWLVGIILGQSLFAIVGTVVFIYLVRNKFHHGHRVRLTWMQIKHFLNFVLPLSLSVALSWISNQGYRFIIGLELDLAQLGTFFIGYSISAGLIAAIESILTTYFQAHFYRSLNDSNVYENMLAWKKYSSAVVPTLILAASGMIVYSRVLTDLLLDSKFEDAEIFIILGALSELMRALSNVLSIASHGLMRTRILIVPNLLTAIVLLFLCYFFIQFFGIVGVSISLILSNIFNFILIFFTLKKKYNLAIHDKYIFFSISISLVLILISIPLKNIHYDDFYISKYIFILNGIIAYGIIEYFMIKRHILSDN